MTYLEKLKAERTSRENYDAFLTKRNEVVVQLATMQNDLNVAQWNELHKILNNEINTNPVFYSINKSA